MEVRLAGTIVPQGPRYNRRARKYLIELIKGKVVDLKAYGVDEKECIVAEVYFGGLNINLEMIRAGVVIVEEVETPAALDLQPYFRVEEEAREARRGVWRTFSLTPNRRAGTKP
jgi:endonuclease YncB( thermonuclease family)